MQVGIHGVGIYLPEQVRTNDWWSPEVVRSWRSRTGGMDRPRQDLTDPTTPGAQAALQGMLSLRDDPFRGTVERRIAPDDMVVSDMEALAAQDALERAGVAKEEIGILLVNSQMPEFLSVTTAAIVHRKLGLPEKCLSMNTDSACNSFLHQMAAAEKMIQGGLSRYALVIQSSSFPHMIRPEDPESAWCGDAATAVVLGPVSDGRGILAQSHRTDGSLCNALVTGSRGSRWYKPGIERVYTYVEDPNAGRAMLMRVPEMGRQVVGEALAQAGYRPDQVDFYATHQATAWFRKVTQEFIGLTNARSFDTFKWTGTLSASNIPMMLGMGERQGLLRAGDLVATYTGGSGIVWSSIILRWGK